MTYEVKLANTIVKLKEVKRNQPELTLQKISDHTGVSMSTVTRIFADGSEEQSFRYDSIRPIAKMLLGLDDLDEGDDDEKALKAIIQLKEAKIEQGKKEIERLKEKHANKIEKERAQYEKKIEFLKHQIELKDDRITFLLQAVEKRSEQYQDLYQQYKEIMAKLLSNKE